MWDEQEHIAKVVAKIFTWLLGALGVVLAAASLATGIPDFLVAFVLLLGALAALVLVYGLVALSIGSVLLGITGGVTKCFHWLRNHFFNRPAG